MTYGRAVTPLGLAALPAVPSWGTPERCRLPGGWQKGLVTIDLFKYRLLWQDAQGQTQQRDIIATEWQEDDFGDGVPTVEFVMVFDGNVDLVVFEIKSAHVISIELMQDTHFQVSDKVLEMLEEGGTDGPVEVGTVMLTRSLTDGEGEEVGTVKMVGPLILGPLTVMPETTLLGRLEEGRAAARQLRADAELPPVDVVPSYPVPGDPGVPGQRGSAE